MKKKTLLIAAVFCAASMLLHAESDLQISNPVLFLGLRFTYAEFDTVLADASPYWQFYAGGVNLLRIKNQNFIKNSRFGFYESISFVISQELFGNVGFEAVLGPAFKIYNGDWTQVNAGIGVNVKIYPDFMNGQGGIEFGAESDMQVKFLPQRKCSPILGVLLNLNFFTNQKAVERINYYDYGTKVYYHDIEKYFNIVFSPYIAFCVNFY